MSNMFLQEYEKLNSDGRKFVECALKGALSNPECLRTTSKEEMQKIKQKQEEADKEKKIEEEKHNQYFAELKEQCDSMTKEDYISNLNEVFQKLPTYKLRYFFVFINAKLSYDA